MLNGGEIEVQGAGSPQVVAPAISERAGDGLEKAAELYHPYAPVEILDDASPDNTKRPPEELSGSLSVEEVPLHKADKPIGQWDSMEITCNGSSLIVVTNGVKTLHLNLDKLTVLHGHHRQYKPVSERPRRGFIGLQGDRGEQVEFRNIRIKEL